MAHFFKDNKINPVLLVIRDGWGLNKNPSNNAHNAIKLAHTPVSDLLSKEWPKTEIATSGLDVGLPEGIMGNSEVGHQNIGAGRIVNQEVVRIDKAFQANELLTNPTLTKLFKHVKNNSSKLHLMGLISDGGIHSMLHHLFELLLLAKKAHLTQVFIHAFSDGRDRPPKSGVQFITQIEAFLSKLGIGKIATICGRYWAMDRDNRWERVERAYNCLIGKKATYKANKAVEVLKHFYEHPESSSMLGDEFIPPSWIVDPQTQTPIAPIENNDGILFFNYRGDRPRELTKAFIKNDFEGFKRAPLQNLCFSTLTEYEQGLCEHVVFPRLPKMKNILGEVISKAKLRQFRCAETEKYPHVTFFFNDYREVPFEGEERVLVPSPRDVATYDLKPEMSAYQVAQATVKAILSQKYALIVVNFANPDMVGHTGNLDATVKAVQAVDACLGKLLSALDKVSGKGIITADHGNAEEMWNEKVHSPHTQHTTYPVELILYGKDCKTVKLRPSGRLADIAPTLLNLANIEKPLEMTGASLIEN